MWKMIIKVITETLFLIQLLAGKKKHSHFSERHSTAFHAGSGAAGTNTFVVDAGKKGLGNKEVQDSEHWTREQMWKENTVS